ncbi:UPF0481 protein At3g47200-like [Alnus glutinosa]|uniref:UPF0481 protein At3g47200-like n=1 Tax=Alnus glutinosa TaxID=3517 RepID=UPI002D776075|nr:UPF0481 protein At3g47200-like [Alnus glutinosa]
MCSPEKKARDCYSGTIDPIESNDFLEMMVLDGCFIIQFLLFFGSRNIGRKVLRDHPLGRMDRDRVMLQKICADLFMLENQIPYFVLELLFKFFRNPSGGRDVSLPIYAVTTFSQTLEIGSFYFEAEDISESYGAECLHLLDLVRSIFIPPDLPYRYRKERFPFTQENWYRPLRTIPRISQLPRAGIMVNPRKKDRFLVVQFVKSLGVIEMPNLSLNELMCSFLVNCVAFEQSYNTHSKHLSVYALFLDWLVNTAQDVEYLCEHRVIDNYMRTMLLASSTIWART